MFDTKSTNGYFFVFLAANSTQNLGNLDADYKGAEFEISGKVTDNFELFGSYGYTDSKITGMEDPSVIGNQAPLVSEVHLQPRRAVPPAAVGGNLSADAARRLPAHRRDLVGAVQYHLARSGRPGRLRLGLEGEKWAVTAWSKNLTDEKYNAEFSPGGFLFRALPRRYGLEFSYDF